MQISDISVVEFVSASTAGAVNVQLGYVPDWAIFIEDHGATPNIRFWFNPNRFWKDTDGDGTADAGWEATVSLIIATAGGITRNTSTLFAAFDPDNADPVAADETDNSDPKHVDQEGVAAKAGRIPAAGLTVAAGAQTNSGRNVLLCGRMNR